MHLCKTTFWWDGNINGNLVSHEAGTHVSTDGLRDIVDDDSICLQKVIEYRTVPRSERPRCACSLAIFSCPYRSRKDSSAPLFVPYLCREQEYIVYARAPMAQPAIRKRPPTLDVTVNNDPSILRTSRPRSHNLAACTRLGELTMEAQAQLDNVQGWLRNQNRP